MTKGTSALPYLISPLPASVSVTYVAVWLVSSSCAWGFGGRPGGGQAAGARCVSGCAGGCGVGYSTAEVATDTVAPADIVIAVSVTVALTAASVTIIAYSVSLVS